MTKKIKNLEYRSDKFLNSNSKKMIPFTGSITCYAGVGYEFKEEKEQTCFIEISDCHTKIRLHPNRLTLESLKEFYKKLNLLSREIENFSNYLENFIEYYI